VVIAGIGNELMSDDGMGVHAARAMAVDPPDGVEVVDIGTAFVRALNVLEGAGALVALDAIQGGGPPGTLYAMDGLDVELSGDRSLHGLGLMGALALGGGSIPLVLVLGIQPKRLDYGLGLSNEVRAGLDRLVGAARLAAEHLRDGATVQGTIQELRIP
jgi:hydrogenase maturation protease